MEGDARGSGGCPPGRHSSVITERYARGSGGCPPGRHSSVIMAGSSWGWPAPLGGRAGQAGPGGTGPADPRAPGRRAARANGAVVVLVGRGDLRAGRGDGRVPGTRDGLRGAGERESGIPSAEGGCPVVGHGELDLVATRP